MRTNPDGNLPEIPSIDSNGQPVPLCFPTVRPFCFDAGKLFKYMYYDMDESTSCVIITDDYTMQNVYI